MRMLTMFTKLVLCWFTMVMIAYLFYLFTVRTIIVSVYTALFICFLRNGIRWPLTPNFINFNYTLTGSVCQRRLFA